MNNEPIKVSPRIIGRNPWKLIPNHWANNLSAAEQQQLLIDIRDIEPVEHEPYTRILRIEWGDFELEDKLEEFPQDLMIEY